MQKPLTLPVLGPAPVGPVPSPRGMSNFSFPLSGFPPNETSHPASPAKPWIGSSWLSGILSMQLPEHFPVIGPFPVGPVPSRPGMVFPPANGLQSMPPSTSFCRQEVTISVPCPGAAGTARSALYALEGGGTICTFVCRQRGRYVPVQACSIAAKR